MRLIHAKRLACKKYRAKRRMLEEEYGWKQE